jgi:hypothetical protein
MAMEAKAGPWSDFDVIPDDQRAKLAVGGITVRSDGEVVACK